jgi:DNA-binding Xre family transcriptional regulator
LTKSEAYDILNFDHLIENGGDNLDTVFISRDKFSLVLGRKCMSRRDVCDQTGITEGNLSIMLKRGNVRPKTAGRIAAALGVDISEIVKLPKEE